MPQSGILFGRRLPQVCFFSSFANEDVTTPRTLVQAMGLDRSPMLMNVHECFR